MSDSSTTIVPIQAPLSGPVTRGSWIIRDLVDGPTLYSGKKLRYYVLLPHGHDKTKFRYPVMVRLHANAQGNRAYRGDDALPSASSADAWYNNPEWRTNWPFIVLLPAADQTGDSSGETQNFGGWKQLKSPNELAVVMMTRQAIEEFGGDPDCITVIGNSLGGHGSWALALDANAWTGTLDKLFTGAVPMAGCPARNGFGVGPTAAQFAAIDPMPIFAVHGAGDRTSQSYWDVGVWNHYAGSVPTVSGPSGAQAGDSNFRLLYDPGLGHDVWDTYCPLPRGRPIYDWMWKARLSSQPPVVVTPPPVVIPPDPSKPPSADGTVVKAGEITAIIDTVGNAWTITELAQVALNGLADASTKNVTQIAWFASAFWQCNQLGAWYVRTAAGGWKSGSNPFAPPPPVVVPGTGFSVKSGLIIAPDGSVFIARGMNVYLESMEEVAANLDRLFPGTNMLRLVFRYAWDTSERTVNFIKQMTARRIVVMLDDHVMGNSKPVPTGATLASQMAWFRTHATTFRDNPYVWYEAQNEPTTGNDFPALSQHDRDTYDAVRGTGNPHMVVLLPPCGGNKGIVGAQGRGYDGSRLNLALYADMVNVTLDLHSYPFMSGYSTDPAVVRAALFGSVAAASGILAAQSIRTADGIPPLIIGEFGDSTVGKTIDTGGSQCVAAVLASGYGFLAFSWCMSNSLAGDVLTTRTNPPQLTPYGRQVAAAIAAGGTPPPPALTLADIIEKVDTLADGLDVIRDALKAIG